MALEFTSMLVCTCFCGCNCMSSCVCFCICVYVCYVCCVRKKKEWEGNTKGCSEKVVSFKYYTERGRVQKWSWIVINRKINNYLLQIAVEYLSKIVVFSNIAGSRFERFWNFNCFIMLMKQRKTNFSKNFKRFLSKFSDRVTTILSSKNLVIKKKLRRPKWTMMHLE